MIRKVIYGLRRGRHKEVAGIERVNKFSRKFSDCEWREEDKLSEGGGEGEKERPIFLWQ